MSWNMIFLVLYKYFNCAVDKAIDTSHSTSTDCNTNYRILLMLLITSWWKPLKIDTCREICSCAIWVKPSFAKYKPSETYMCLLLSIWKCLILIGVSLENQIFGCLIECRGVALWCIGYGYCTTSFNLAWTHVLCKFRPSSRHVRDLWWWGSDSGRSRK